MEEIHGEEDEGQGIKNELTEQKDRGSKTTSPR